ncbi:MAG: hypothetical protein K7J46_10835 [Bryobacter sp.]|jgi:uncharacterized protein (TIGR03437 family)|nr:hypothetical protein [Bryobacter sp. CoA8 C33]
MFNRFFWSAVLSALPLLLFARSGGAPIRRTGAAIDGGQDCSACHRTSAANSDSRGFVRINAVNYTPGQRQTIRVQVFHPEASRWGFQLTARLASNENNKAGTLTPNSLVQVNCDPSGNAPCGNDREFATHLAPATTQGASGLATFSVEWTAPAEGSGDVVLYAAGNAADNGGSNAGDRIYTTSLRLSPAPALSRPTVSSDGAIAVGAFGGGRTISPGSWIEIFGTSLSNITREWATWDFTGSNAPRSLEGVSVTVGGRDAFIRYVSPGQVNAQVPDGIGSGSVNVVVTNAAGASSNIQMTAAPRSPGLLAFPASGARQLAVALLPDGAFVARTGEIATSPSRPARPGETITLYLIGGGATTPPTPAGSVAAGTPTVPNPQVRFGEAPATVSYAGLAPGAVGLYQFNVVVPNVAPGDTRLSLSIDGTATPQTLTTVIGN